MKSGPDPSGGPLPSVQAKRKAASIARRSMRNITIAWIFGAMYIYITTIGSVRTKFAQLIGMPPFGFGVLSALPFLGALIQLPTSYFLARYGHRKRLLLITGIANRGLWVVIAAIPWFLPDAWWWPGLLVLVALSSFCGHIMIPACTTWFADVIPERIRARYLPRRGQIGQLVGLLATVVVGCVLHNAQLAGERTLLLTISAILAIGSVLGMIDFLWLIPVPDTTHRPDRGTSWSKLLRGPLSNRDFRLYLGFIATQMLGLGFLGQFVKLYLLDIVEMTVLQVDVMMVVGPLALSLTVIRLWGRLMHRLGCKPVMIITGLLIIHGAASWIFVTPERWWPGYIGVMVASAAWPGMELAKYNWLLGMSRSKQGEGDGSAYVAVNWLVIAVAGAISGLFGGAMATALGEWKGTFLGQPLTYHGVLFLISAGLRAAALFWLWGMHEPKAYATKAAIQYVAGTVYTNALRMRYGPMRLFIKLRRMASKLSRNRNNGWRDGE